MSLVEFLGFSLAREAVSPRTQLIHVADRNVWQDISGLSVKVPAPPPMPVGVSVWQGVNHLIDCYTQVMLHLEHPKYPARSALHVIKGMLAKNPSVAAAATTFVQATQRLSAEGSELSPLIWTQWRIKNLLANNYSPYCLRAVWTEKVASKKLRRFFYEDTGFEALGGQPLWPTAASNLLAWWRQLEKEVAPMTQRQAEARWADARPEYLHLHDQATEQKKMIAARLTQRVDKLDLQLWNTPDVLAYLKLNKRAAPLSPVKRKVHV